MSPLLGSWELGSHWTLWCIPVVSKLTSSYAKRPNRTCCCTAHLRHVDTRFPIVVLHSNQALLQNLSVNSARSTDTTTRAVVRHADVLASSQTCQMRISGAWGPTPPPPPEAWWQVILWMLGLLLPGLFMPLVLASASALLSAVLNVVPSFTDYPWRCPSAVSSQLVYFPRPTQAPPTMQCILHCFFLTLRPLYAYLLPIVGREEPLTIPGSGE